MAAIAVRWPGIEMCFFPGNTNRRQHQQLQLRRQPVHAAVQTDPEPRQEAVLSQSSSCSRLSTIPESEEDDMSLTLYSDREHPVEMVVPQPSRKRMRTIYLAPSPLVHASNLPPELKHFQLAAQGANNNRRQHQLH